MTFVRTLIFALNVATRDATAGWDGRLTAVCMVSEKGAKRSLLDRNLSKIDKAGGKLWHVMAACATRVAAIYQGIQYKRP